MIYRCPFCGKQYTSRVAMSECAAKCARALDEMEEKVRLAEEAERVAKEKAAQVKVAAKRIDDAYDNLQKAINEYRAVGGDQNIQVRMTRADNVNSDFLWGKDSASTTRGKRADAGVLDEFRQTTEAKDKDFEKFLKENLGIKPEAPKKETAIDRLEKYAKESGETGWEKDFEELKQARAKLDPRAQNFVDLIMDSLLTGLED